MMDGLEKLRSGQARPVLWRGSGAVVVESAGMLSPPDFAADAPVKGRMKIMLVDGAALERLELSRHLHQRRIRQIADRSQGV